MISDVVITFFGVESVVAAAGGGVAAGGGPD